MFSSVNYQKAIRIIGCGLSYMSPDGTKISRARCLFCFFLKKEKEKEKGKEKKMPAVSFVMNK
jgi:hypothetical protein